MRSHSSFTSTAAPPSSSGSITPFPSLPTSCFVWPLTLYRRRRPSGQKPLLISPRRRARAVPVVPAVRAFDTILVIEEDAAALTLCALFQARELARVAPVMVLG